MQTADGHDGFLTTTLALQDATELVAKYAARASSQGAELAACSPCRLVRCGFGAAVGRSWPLSPPSAGCVWTSSR